MNHQVFAGKKKLCAAAATLEFKLRLLRLYKEPLTFTSWRVWFFSFFPAHTNIHINVYIFTVCIHL